MTATSEAKIAFVYPGIGGQWKRMGYGLIDEPVFKSVIKKCDREFSGYVGWSIEEEIRKPVSESRLEQTSIGYPCGIGIKIALTSLLAEWGIKPDGVLGHSGGEITAAYTSGILNLEDAFHLVWLHQEIITKGGGRGMMAHISLPEKETRELLAEHKLEQKVFTALYNSPKSTVVSGASGDIEHVLSILEDKNIFCRPLYSGVAFHSPLAEVAMDADYLDKKKIHAGGMEVPLYSSLLGRLSSEPDYTASYWRDLLIKEVRFIDGVRAMLDDGFNVFVEVGTHPVLSRSIREIVDVYGSGDEKVISMLKRDENDNDQVLEALAGLTLAGCAPLKDRLKKKNANRLDSILAKLKEENERAPVKQETPEQAILWVLKKILPGVNPSVDGNGGTGFFDMGIDSVSAVTFSDMLGKRLGRRLPATLIFDCPDIKALARSSWLTARREENEEKRGTGKKWNQSKKTAPKIPLNKSFCGGPGGGFLEKSPLVVEDIKINNSIAIVGMACRFPGGANDLESFWELLRSGGETVGDVPVGRWDGDAFFAETVTAGKSLTKSGHFLAGVDIKDFDAGFFRISPKEAESLDPQQRLFLEVSVEALENAGIAFTSLRDKRVGIFTGICMDDYKRSHYYSPDFENIDPYAASGSMINAAAGRLSYFFGTRGPSVAVDTACSASITAFHLAVRSLRAGECSMALAGGVNALVTPIPFIGFSQLSVLSRDGRCKTFDESADGYGRGEGCGVLVLKRLSDARRDNDSILALIEGSAINHDGASTGFTAPSGAAQREVIKTALADAGIGPDSVDYVEAHGSGTSLGDPIEINALADVYGEGHSKEHPLLVGAVKTNIGHLEGAAGAAGVIKTVLAMQHNTIPPHINFSTPNSLIDWDHISVRVTSGPTPWNRHGHPRRAGVSGFGFSGSNGHLILEEAPGNELKDSGEEKGTAEPGVGYPVHVLSLSARDEESLTALAESYKTFLDGKNLPRLGDICYTAAAGRAIFDCRLAIKGRTVTDMQKTLSLFLEGRARQWFFNNRNGGGFNKEIVFLFTGQGSQYLEMGKEFFLKHPVFREAMERCSELFEAELGVSVVGVLYGEVRSSKLEARREEKKGTEARSSKFEARREEKKGTGTLNEVIDRPLVAQPAIFSLQYSLVALWRSFGVMPGAVLGHSIGEYAAACAAGIFSLEDAVKLVSIRARLMEEMPSSGRMVGILAGEDNVEELIAGYDDVSVAAVNTHENITISGGNESIEKILEEIKRQKVFVERLNISHPFHSILMQEYVEPFRREIEAAGITFNEPVLTFIPARNEGTGAAVDYWATQLREPVRFYPCLTGLAEQGYRLFLEMGGTATLAGLAGQALGDEYDDAVFLPSLRKGKDGWDEIMTSVARLTVRGVDMDWNGFYRGAMKKVLLPNYRFRRKRYWRENLDRDLAVMATNRSGQSLSNQGSMEQEEKNTGTANDVMDVRVTGKNVEKRTIMEEIIIQLKEMVHSIAGLSPGEYDGEADLLELGMDSLMLVELRRKIVGQYGVDITLNQFFMELTTAGKIAAFIGEHSDALPQIPVDGQLPVETAAVDPGPAPAAGEYRGAVPAGTASDASEVERIMARQMDAMKDLAEKQLETLRQMGLKGGQPQTTQSGAASVKQVEPVKVKAAAQPKKTTPPAPKPLNFSSSADLRHRGLNEKQQQHLDALIDRYTKLTANSKKQTDAYRQVLADSKTTVGFNMSTKEMLYPLIGKRAEGSRLWDIDDNEFIDITMGFGVYLFGHHPGFMREAMRSIAPDSTELGPRSYLVGEVAEMVARMTGMERVTFTNTGTEAVMAAIRLARAATGRSKIAMFARSYHGHSDNTLAVSTVRYGELASEPVSPGIPQGVADEVLVLDYLEESSLELLKKRGHQLAAVLVEPIQSRYPGVNPGPFLRQLRDVTRQTGTLLIFDEMITGFRIHPGGAQAYFGVEADICTYGKIVGGGLPIGVIAGKARYMDHIDGGYWQYGDASYPAVERTFFGGTFCQYHEAMVTAHAVLKQLEKEGPGLQEQLNRKMDGFAGTLNRYFEENEVAIRLEHSCSIFRFDIPGGMDLFYYHLLEKGVYVWEWRCCFLSAVHTGDDLDRVTEAVKETVEELRSGGYELRRRKKKTGLGSTGGSGEVETSKEGVLPMSSVQKRIFALSQTEDSQRAYHVPNAVHIRGELDLEKTKKAIGQIVYRHESLRTALVVKDGEPVQRIYEPGELRIEVLFKKKWGAADQDAIDESMAWFDLSKPPLMRICLWETGENEYVLATNFHHAVMDGSSLNLFVKEFLALYRGEELPPVKMHYRHFVRWEEQFYRSSEFSAQREYWLGRLGDVESMPELPMDYPRPGTGDFRGKTLKAFINREMTAGLKKMARESRVSLNMLLVALYNVLISKLTGCHDICIGIPVNARGLEDLDRSLGMYTNTLVIRSRPEPGLAFREFLDQVKLDFLGDLSNQDYPYEELVVQLGDVIENMSGGPGELGRNPLFDAAFVYENGNERLYKIPGLEFKTSDLDIKASPFDLVWQMIEEEGTFNLGISFRTALFKEETVRRWFGFFLRLVEGVLENPQTPLSGLELMSGEEKETILYTFNDTATDYPREKSIAEIFVEQVEKTPDRIALAGVPGLFLTYRELDERADALAGQLEEELAHSSKFIAYREDKKVPGTKSGEIIALMTDRSVNTVIAIMGILEAGCAYMPIDEDYPDERIRYMLEDSGAPILLTLSQENRRDRFLTCPTTTTIITYENQYVSLRKKGARHQKKGDRRQNGRQNEYDPEGLAYVMYTSGSTGKPKGVMVNHRNVSRVVKKTNYIDITPADRLMRLSNYAFDGSVFDIFGALLNGAALVLNDWGGTPSVDRVAGVIREQGIDVFFVTTALFNTLLDVDIDCFRHVRNVLFGGERVSLEHARKALDFMGPGRVLHMYGPTETTVFATCHPIGQIEPDWSTIPIGKPVSNTTVYILDKQLNPVPIGIAGEIYISGDGLASGYMNESEMTANVFLATDKHRPEAQTSTDFFLIKSFAGGPGGSFFKSAPPGRRRQSFYKSGDLARWMGDGNIEFMGRIDQQVKIRGFRIEPGEIEKRLMELGQVETALVTVRVDKGGDRYLCAYVVGAGDAGAVDAGEIKKELEQSLPGYMVPRFIVLLERMPLTANGKIDTRALPEPVDVEPGEEFTAPRNGTETTLVQLWADVLGLNGEQIGIDDNFFRLGGHSLKAALLIHRVNESFGIDLKLRNLFELSTVRRLAEMTGETGDAVLPVIEPVGKQDYYKMSSAQRRLFVIQQMDKTGTGYNMPVVFRVRGDLDTERLEKTVNVLMERHESLRTSFHMIDDEPVQRIAEWEGNYKLQITDSKHIAGNNIEIPNREWIRPFDLTKAPLFRMELMRLSEGDYFLMIDMHHIISDGISLGVFLREFQAIYSAPGETLPGLPVQYKDFASWQLGLPGSGRLDEQERYWLDRFKGEIPVCELPLDFSRPPVQRFEGDRFDFGIDEAVTRDLNGLAVENGCTLFMVLLTIYKIFVFKLTGARDLIMGSPTAGRGQKDLENIMGMFVNTLAIRTSPLYEKTVLEFLGEVKECVLDAYDNQDYQYEDLVEKVAVERDLSRNPLFDVVFALENKELNRPYRSMELAGVTVERADWGERNSKFDLTLFAEESETDILFGFEYSTHLFKRETIERFAGYFMETLKNILAGPERYLAEIEAMPGDEKKKILEDFNDTATRFPGDKTLDELFEEQVRKTPDRTAITCGDTVLTYKELHRKADLLAARLLETGVGEDSIMGLMVEKPVDKLTGIWGILKTGSAYLPLDPGFPAERIQYMMDDCNTNILVTSSETAKENDVVETWGRDAVFLDEKTMGKDGSTTGIKRSPGSLAYIMYTSGSTGKPKGVMTSHRNVIRVVRDTNYIKIDPGDRLLQLSNYGFDGSTFDIFGAHLNGGALVLADWGNTPAVDRVIRIIREEHVTVFFVTTALFNTIVDVDIQCLENIRKVLFGGERVSLEHAAKALEHLGPGRILHMYGPTETTVFATCFPIDKIPPRAYTVPIGKPISNTTLYILDAVHCPVPLGVCGELYIGGQGVARGYLNNPELTAKFYINHEEHEGHEEKEKAHGSWLIARREEKDKKLTGKNELSFPTSYELRATSYFYKSGDLARWLVGGVVEFLGRLDQQVKVRGFRIELGEIESRFREWSGIDEVVVTVGLDGRGDKYLCAYVVSDGLDEEALRADLSGKLPGYMVPRFIVVLEAMPLNVNGKIDRKALPEPTAVKSDDFAGARDETEERLVEIWEEVLGLESGTLGIDDHFFKRGGHSLKAMVMAAQIYKSFGVQVPLTVVFECLTVRRLAEYVKSNAGGVEKPGYEAIPKLETKGAYPLSSAQKRLFAVYHRDPQGTAYNMPTVVVLEGALDRARLEQVFHSLIRRHEVLRTSFTIEGKEAVQVVHETIDFSVDYYQIPGPRNPEVNRKIAGFVKPFDLSAVPLLRVGLIETSDTRHVLMFDMPHIVSDGRSQEILIREMLAFYGGESLPALDRQYKDFSVWQGRRYADGELARQEAYWLEQFPQGDAAPGLPLDFQRPANRTFAGALEIFEITGETVESLKAICDREGTTVFMAVLALFNIFLSKITGKEDIPLGTPVAGRIHPDLEDMMGMFVNTLVLRNFPAKDRSFTDFLKEVKKRALDAFDNQEYPFEDLVDKVVKTDREAGRHPLFDVMFSFSAQEAGMWDKVERAAVGELKVKPYDAGDMPVKFDLLFSGEDLGHTLRFVFEYAAELFKKDSIQRFAGYFKDMAAAVAGNENILLRDIAISHSMVNAETDLYEEDSDDFGF